MSQNQVGNEAMEPTYIPGVEEIVEVLLDVVPHTKVSHHVPGEIKLQIMLSIFKLKSRFDFRALASRIPGVLDARTSLIQRSVTIRYDERQLPYDLWESLVQLKKTPERKPQVTAHLKEVLERQ